MTKNSKTILTVIAITAIASLVGATSYLSMSVPVFAAQQTVPEGPNGDGDGETNDDVKSSTSDSFTNQKPVITGSVNVDDTIKKYINENKKISFSDAAITAEKQVKNGSVVRGHVDIEQGYLVYTFSVIDTQSDISYKIIIDAGDGKILNTSEGMPFESHEMHDFGDHEMHGSEVGQSTSDGDGETNDD